MRKNILKRLIDNLSSKVGWNFHKFLIDENGKWVASYGSSTNPLSEEIVKWIEE